MQEAEIPGTTPVESTTPTLAKGSRVLPVLAVWTRDLLVALSIAAFIIIFLYEPVRVEGTSMMPSLDDQERIFVNKFVYRLGPIQRGDIVVFHYPRDPSTSYIKRVVGVAGDEIRIEDGQVILNGQPIEEEYVPKEYADQSSFPAIRVPGGSYYVLGDHRNKSKDSREFGPVPQEYVFGKAVFGYWPMQKMGRLR